MGEMKTYVRKTRNAIKLNARLSTTGIPCSQVTATTEEISAYKDLGQRNHSLFHAIAERAALLGQNGFELKDNIDASTRVDSPERRFLNNTIKRSEPLRNLIEKFHEAGRNLH